ncbi:hypothetical protein AtubIFM57258_002459 [Aspergillus tubingensis]|nr:hypothetical protein AtubIFM57258_002459 [Aspergillus tubingensis]
MVRDKCTGRVRQVSPPVPQGDKSNGQESSADHSEKQTGGFTWSHWMTQDSRNVIDLGDEAPLPRGNVSFIAPHPPQRHSAKARCDASSVSHQWLSSSILTPAPLSRQQEVDLQNPTVPSWDESIQLPENHQASARARRSKTPSASQDAATAVSGSARAPSASISHHYLISSDYLSVRRGARARYIGQAFWGFVTGKVSTAQRCKQNPGGQA